MYMLQYYGEAQAIFSCQTENLIRYVSLTQSYGHHMHTP